MLILGLTSPEGQKHYITAAFPSACGKTNLAMLVPPATMPGWKAETVGDDIAWLRPGDDGRLWAVNPEAGFFGVVPGTSAQDQPQRDRHDPAATPSSPTWRCAPTARRGGRVTTIRRRPRRSTGRGGRGRRRRRRRRRIPNSRFTAPASQCASISPEFENPKGVPIDAMLFGARRQRRVPLVYQSRNWQHGTFLGATLSSETTAAATGKVGVLRRDPMAMLPFCGYNMGDYFGHWLDVGKKLTKPPKIFRVNWFRTGDNGKFLWPGFGDNLRVLKWILERCEGARRRRSRRRSASCRRKNAHRSQGPRPVATRRWRRCSRSIRPSGPRRSRARRSSSTRSATTCRKEMREEHDELARRVSDAMTSADLQGRDVGH